MIKIKPQRLLALLPTLLIASLLIPGCSSEAATTSGASLEPGGQSTQLEADLLQLREEEKLARDVYLTLYDKWKLDIFQNISSSEQKHMDKVGVLLDGYGIPDPITDDTVGVFTDETIAGLYDALVAQGMESSVQALLVGATIEDLDIFDIREMRSHTDNALVIDTYDKLECGSNNHLNAFMGQLDALETEYTAQYLSEDEIEAILSAGSGPCGNGNGNGNGGRNGRGRRR